MKLLFDFFPVILMYVSFQFFGIYVATGVAMVACVVQVSYLKFRKEPIKPMVWVTAGVILVAGTATIWLKNEMFIKWKPTIIFSIMAMGIAVMQYGFKKNPIAMLFNDAIQAPEPIWKKLALAWILFLLFSGCLNLYFVYFQSTNAWMNFKTFGEMGLMVVFIIAQMFWLAPYLPKDDDEQPAITEPNVATEAKKLVKAEP